METKYNKIKRIISYFLIFPSLLMLCACSQKHKAYVSTSTQIRDNTPNCLLPEAGNSEVYENELVSVDISNSSQGYIIVTYKGINSNVKVMITGSDYMTYTYDVFDNKPVVFPISAGNGSYNIGIYELVEGNAYSTIFSEDVEITIENEFGPFLYPNQYVDFNSESKVVEKAKELVAPAHDNLEAITYIYNYLIENITYDKPKAESIESGYIPDVDYILDIKTGICLDYAAVMTSMLRSQSIPTRMEVGYAGTAYHAWISCYDENIGWINGLVEFDGTNWSLMDPTVAASSGDENLAKFIGKGDSYLTQYTY